MKTIKIIDLLNKIANGEEIPKKIKYGVHFYEYKNKARDYLSETGDSFLVEDMETGDLNNKLEITDICYLINQLGEDLMKGFKAGMGIDNEIKKLNPDRYAGTDLDITRDMFDKINELIDKVNNL